MLFLLAAGAKKEEEHGEPQLRGVCGEVADSKLREEIGRGREGWGRTMARAGTADERRVCMIDDNRNEKEGMID